MTTFAVPPTGCPAWREIYPTPPNAQLYTVGPFCPLDDTQLQERADGFGCPACSAAWDFHGLSGRWLALPAVRWRPSAIVVLAGLAGCAAVSFALVAVLAAHDELVWWLAAVLAVIAVLYPAAGWVSRRVADRPYQHNRLGRRFGSLERALFDDERDGAPPEQMEVDR